MKEKFEEGAFRADSMALIESANEILAAYAKEGYDLSLRQLYYQLVTQNILPNNQKSYNRLGALITKARMAGLVDWNMIVDRGRDTITPASWDSPLSIMQAVVSQYQTDRWANQPIHVEVMVEKQALEGVFAPVCRELFIPFTANKGYSSASFMYRRGKHLGRITSTGKRIKILYFGDHDPSGLDMDRDVEDRLALFGGMDAADLEVTRVALTRDQIDEHNPPPNPAKMTDSRADDYVAEHGLESWELDALNPRILAGLVRSFVETNRDPDLWEEALEAEKEGHGWLQEAMSLVVSRIEEKERNEG